MRMLTTIFLSLLIMTVNVVTDANAQLTPNQDNEVFYRNFENIYDADGNYVAPNSRSPRVGDHFMGIFNIQNINVGGVPSWFQSASDQITGIFAQRIEAIYPVGADPFDSAQTSFPHYVLGPPTITTFCRVADCISTLGLLGPGEMFALFRQTGGGTTPFEYNGSIADDVAKATDGSLWLTLGYKAGPDGVYGTADDDGYFYSHANVPGPLSNFTGEAWGALNAVVNNTGYPLARINDPNESEIGGPGGLISGLLNSIHMSSELEGNPDSPLVPGAGDFSPWDIRSNDPAHIFPYEPSKKSGYKFNDLNANGIRDNGEPGLEGWMIHLQGTDFTGNTVHQMVSTNIDGYYEFIVPAGTYIVCESFKEGWVQSAPATGANCDADGIPGDGTGYNVVLGPGVVETGNNFGNYQEVEAACRVTAGGNKDGYTTTPCTLKSNGMPDAKTCVETGPDTWGGQAGAPPRVDGNWTHHHKPGPTKSFVFHSNDLFWISCSDPGCCVPACANAKNRQIDFSGIGKFSNQKGFSFPKEELCFSVHLEDIGEPGPGGRWPSATEPCTHCPGTPIEDGDCVNCTDYYEIRIYDSATYNESGQCTGKMIYVNGPGAPANCGAGEPNLWGYFIRAGNVQMHPDNNGP